MNPTPTGRRGWSKAAASLLFSVVAIFLYSDYSAFHAQWMLAGVAHALEDSTRFALNKTFADHILAYRVLAAAGLVWAGWSWFGERRAAAAVATVVALYAVLCAATRFG